MATEREQTYDSMKGIGILLVLLGHVWQWNGTIPHTVICSFHMSLFFIVAGYFSKSYDESKGHISQTILKYFKRLYMPQAVVSLLLVLWFVIKSINKTKYSNRIITTLLSPIWASTVPLQTPCGDISVIAWFLMALLCAKIIFLFLSKWDYWGGLVSLLLSVFSFWISSYKPLVPWCLLQGCIALPFLFIGWWWRRKLIPEWSGILLVPIWICAILYSHMDMYSLTFECFPLDMFGAVGGAWVIYQFSKAISRYTRYLIKVLAFLGVCSLSIYSWHSFDITGNVSHQIFCWLGMQDNAVLDYVLRYSLTIAIGIAATKLPFPKKVFA